MNNFSKELKKLINLSSLKISYLSNYLDYDSSYLSKWISGKNLPSEKNIDLICEKISEAIITNISDKNLNLIFEYFNIKDTDSNLKLRDILKHHLLDSYFYTINKQTKKDILIDDLEILPEYIKSNISNKINQINSDSQLEIILIADVFNSSNKNSYYDILKSITTAKNFNACITCILSTTFLSNDLIKNISFLSKLLVKSSENNLMVYISDLPIYNELVIVKDYFVRFNVLYQHDKYLSTFSIYDNNEVLNLFSFYKKQLTNNYSLLNPNSCNNISSYIINYSNKNFKYFLMEFNELFIPKNLFDKYKDQSLDFNIYNLIQLSFCNDIKIILNRQTLYDFIKNGKLDFLGTKLYLDFNDRILYLNNIISILESHQNIDIQLISLDMSESDPLFSYTTYMISENSIYLRSVSYENEILMDIADKSLISLYNLAFDELLSSKSKQNSSSKEELISLIETIKNIH